MSLWGQIRHNMAMQKERKASEEPDEDDSWSMSQALQGKIGSQLLSVGKIFIKSIEMIIRQFRDIEDDGNLYDLDAVDEGEWSPERVKIWIINGVNIATGLIGGFLVQNYLSYRSLRFMAFAAGVDFSELHGRTLASPITILVDIMFFLAFYLALGIVFTFFYHVMHFLFKRDLMDCKEICQVGYMYGVMCAVISTLLGIILPFNIFM